MTHFHWKTMLHSQTLYDAAFWNSSVIGMLKPFKNMFKIIYMKKLGSFQHKVQQYRWNDLGKTYPSLSQEIQITTALIPLNASVPSWCQQLKNIFSDILSWQAWSSKLRNLKIHETHENKQQKKNYRCNFKCVFWPPEIRTHYSARTCLPPSRNIHASDEIMMQKRNAQIRTAYCHLSEIGSTDSLWQENRQM